MAEEPPRGFIRGIADRIRDKIGEKAAEKIIEWLVSLGLGSIVLAWVTREWTCIKQSQCQVPGWLHGLLIVATVSGTAGTVLLAFKLHRARRELRVMKAQELPVFNSIDVEDRKLKLRWIIRRPPKEWLHWRNVEKNISPETVHAVLDGPFHDVPRCLAPLAESHGHGINELMPPTFAEQCQVCEQHIFQGYTGPTARVRAQALEEVQRMNLNGTKLEGRTAGDPPIILEKPAYWRVMQAPK